MVMDPIRNRSVSNSPRPQDLHLEEEPDFLLEDLEAEESQGPEEIADAFNRAQTPRLNLGSTPLRVGDALRELRALEIEDSGQRRDVNRLINQLSRMDRNSNVPSRLLQQLNLVEASNVQEALPLEEEPVGSGRGSLRSEVENLVTQIRSSTLPEAKRSSLLSKLERARSRLDLNQENSISQASDLLSEVRESFEALSQMPKAVLDLASKLNKDPELVMSAAEDAGLNLERLPERLDDKMMRFLEALGIPAEADKSEFNRLKQERKDHTKSLKDKLQAQTNQWRLNSENVPNTSDFQRSYDYFQKKDPEFRKLEDLQKSMRSKIMETLSTLGFRVEVGESSDQIKVNETSYDFMHEMTDTYGFSTSRSDMGNIQYMDDFYPAPMNTEARVNQGVEYTWYHNHAPAGYPTETFDSG